MGESLESLARCVGGELVRPIAAADSPGIVDAVVLDEARPGTITFIDHADREKRLAESQASAAIVPRGVTSNRPVIQVDNVHQAFTTLVLHFHPPRTAQMVGKSPHAYISPTAKTADDVQVHPCAVIGDEVEIGAGSVIHSGVVIMAGCRIAEGVTVYPGAVLYENTVVGPRCIIHACAVLGADGFGYSMVKGRHVRSSQLGYVELEADVEVGPGTTIDRGTYGATRIGMGTKIDDQVMVAHNCRIGRHNILCSQVGIAGSASTGDYVVMAGQVGVRDHVHIGDRAMLGAKAGIMNHVPVAAKVVGIPAVPEREHLVMLAASAKLPETRKQIRRLERQVEELAAQLAAAQAAIAQLTGGASARLPDTTDPRAA